jgi:uncharacterized protein YdeI (YjbR/CyaY-like superfamily)
MTVSEEPMATDPRIDAYIRKSQPFAHPILTHLRAVVHAGCPGVEETLKWGTPAYTYKGKILSITAGFKQHCAFVLWNGEQALKAADSMSSHALGQLRRITSLEELPPRRALVGYVKAAARLIDDGGAPARARRPRKPSVRIPADLKEALALDARAKATFDALSPSHKREYVEWITEAKTAPTRERRLATTLEWLAEGKHRYWNYSRR